MHNCRTAADSAQRPKAAAESSSSSSSSSHSGVQVYGRLVDEQTRCVHYSSPLDIVAIQFHCCRRFFPCFRCHAETATDHEATVWPQELIDVGRVLCGSCWSQLSIREYVTVASSRCPRCDAAFNPRCSLHYHLYFQLPAQL